MSVELDKAKAVRKGEQLNETRVAKDLRKTLGKVENLTCNNFLQFF